MTLTSSLRKSGDNASPALTANMALRPSPTRTQVPAFNRTSDISPSPLERVFCTAFSGCTNDLGQRGPAGDRGGQAKRSGPAVAEWFRRNQRGARGAAGTENSRTFAVLPRPGQANSKFAP